MRKRYALLLRKKHSVCVCVYHYMRRDTSECLHRLVVIEELGELAGLIPRAVWYLNVY